MQRRPMHIFMMSLCAAALLCGCARLKLALHDPSYGHEGEGYGVSRATLVRFQDPPKPKDDESEAPATPDEKSGEADAGKREGDETETQEPKPAFGYTAPGLPYQQLAVAVTAAVVNVVEEASELGRELSESIAMSDMGTIGRLGLTAPPTQFAGRVTGRPGLQDGPATGLGFAQPDRNLFVPQLNALSGATGRCRDLAAAGFYGGSPAACEQSFRR